ncbi:ABC transporter ATP-binding protein [Corynebacterium uberis]|uniref:ABC transporter ATP-binding protein n=1 Tax=Corynebacterium TaxID=1716 RepID=UPI001D0B0B49|nr:MULTISPECIES: ABC transporter ATP-binding protein [Corynebacterium]MCZ9309701.1 ABC transporter ATP-binding protein [Corynebacterium sp. c6VSa_13]UDL73505.1 ABC transporter ATP-binding protein [Corynebacterium uberis]UDL75615.1 ABC transporter ATP-binding protein [Corynebacterium uberis]UDL77828.1 ABC transporter ATP-binding protein [Corynebacterium uberis]UDL80111.1 ABC transporter ATP-binding protein [Corynebacterium uberis]
MIILHNSSKKIAGRTFWSDMSVDFPAGSVTALTGPSGAGKSTLLNCLGCLDRPDSGTLSIDGVELGRASERLRRKARAHYIGYLFQDYALVDNESVYNNLRLAARGARPRSFYDDLLKQVGLEGRGRDVVHQLSGGQQQRVAVARLLVRKPQVVLADEPTGALDPANAQMVLDHLWAMAREGACVVIATHDREIVQRCDAQLTLGETSAPSSTR